MSTASKKPHFGGVGRVSSSEPGGGSPGSPTSRSEPRSSTPSGHVRTRSTRAGTPVSARAAASRRENNLSTADAEARAEAAAALEDLQRRLEREEMLSEKYRKQAEVLQSKLDDAVKESAKLEEKLHEDEEQMEALRNEKREATRQIREMESIYEAEKSSILKEKEEMANKEEEMQAIIQRLKDSLAQRHTGDDDTRPSRQGEEASAAHASRDVAESDTDTVTLANSSPSVEGSGFAPPSSLQRSDSRNSSKLILQKDKLIESLRLELAEAQIKLVESENSGGGRLHEVERLLMEARMANARLMEDNESYQLLLQEKTLKGDFGQSDFSYMGASSNQEALNALEGKTGDHGTGSSLADELSEAAQAEGDSDRRLEAELKSMKEQNKALTLYINKIIERLLQHQDFESILDQSSDSKHPDTNKSLPSVPQEKPTATGQSLLQRAKSIAMGPDRPKQRPASISQHPAALSGGTSAHTDPTRAPSIPIGNLTRSSSIRRSRPQSEQYGGAASLVSQMYRGGDGGPASPTLTNPRHSQAFFASAASANANAATRVTSGSQASSGNFPGVRSETSSVSGESGDASTTTPPSQSPPRSIPDRQTTFAGSKPRPLRLVQENPDAVKDKENKRSSWYMNMNMNWASWGKKEEQQAQAQSDPIPE